MTDNKDSLAEEGMRVETAARSYDPVGWAWYDRADTDHPAKPVFRERAFSQMRAALDAFRAQSTSQPTELERELTTALRALHAAVEKNPSMQGRQYVGLGIAVTNTLAKATERGL